MVLLVLIYFTALYAVFAPWPRYGVPLRPELYLWCSGSLAMLSEKASHLIHRLVVKETGDRRV
jgi:hypothetical protein